LWAANDRWDAVNGVTLRWEILTSSGRVLQQGSQPQIALAADSSRRVGKAEWTVASNAGPHQLRAELIDAAGKVISENVYEFMVVSQ
jgi:hypothetical protein